MNSQVSLLALYFSLVFLVFCSLQQIQDCQVEDNDGDCNTDPDLPRSLGENCTLNNDCRAPAVCYYSTCVCPVDYIGNADNTTCIKAPFAGQQCYDGRCQWPLICDDSTNFCTKCPDSMVLTETGCMLNCTENEVAGTDRCLPKVTTIGESCEQSAQCTVAYALCEEGTCACAPGTTADATNSKCVIDKYKCPLGSPLVDVNNTLIQCKLLHCPTGRGHERKFDTCPYQYQCLIPSWQVHLGYCCPVELPWCPVGEPLVNKTCGAVQYEDQRCPLSTHHCFTTMQGNSFCCPKPCTTYANQLVVVVDGICYPRVFLGQGCSINDQCPPNAQCIHGVCSCSDGYSQQRSATGDTCAKRCESNQVAVRGSCYSLVLPMSKCEYSAQCLSGTKCRQDICQCGCKEVLHNGHCIPIPRCPSGPGGSYRSAIKDRNGYFECIPPSPYSLVLEFNPCAGWNGVCYPNSNMRYGGICCPLPQISCPGGLKPETTKAGKPVKCTTRRPLECKADKYFCYDYVQVTTGLMYTGVKDGVCCNRFGW